MPDAFEHFKGRTVTVFLKNSFRYRGVLKEVYPNSILLRDFKDGDMILSTSEIRQVVNNGGV